MNGLIHACFNGNEELVKLLLSDERIDVSNGEGDDQYQVFYFSYSTVFLYFSLFIFGVSLML